MTVRNDVIATYARTDISDDEKRRLVYNIKSNGLMSVAQAVLGNVRNNADGDYRVEGGSVLPDGRLQVEVTFIRPEGDIKLTIVITNPPITPRNPGGNERNNLLAAIDEMFEGFVPSEWSVPE